MRTFISIPIPENIKEEILKIQKQFPEFEGKITEFDNLHLTLKFLGEIDDEKLDEVKKRLSKIKMRRFFAEVINLGVFDERQVKIIWLYLKNCNDLQKEIDFVLKGIFPAEKNFMPHLTIARVKNVRNQSAFLEKLKQVGVSKLKFGVDKFYLMSSELNDKGPEYEIIGEFGLI
ncbi:RNA 2',3'-cyclic phosphodiesterase [Candidatus Pacearchaeota archaeon]|nr:RNA 2',3'-cyclic phosphodiesterase [Candidatus Pacearchaeota archaeon]